MMLASLKFWETAFRCNDNKGYDGAANSLILEQHRRGIYDPTRLRGRGAWWDEGRVVVHLGNRLIVDGSPMDIRDLKTELLYEVGPKIKFANAEPISSKSANGLIDLCRMFSWERPISAMLFAGWCAIAPVCGALNWRSHIFVTGGAGSGKSWVLQNVAVKLLGQAGLPLASSVTEPGIRRALGSDALPVVVDELEAKDQMGVQRVEAIMGLMRYSSSETDAFIVKGSQGGGGVEMFRVRSMFCTAAIGNLLQDYADLTRTSVLTLKAVTGSAGDLRFGQIKDFHRQLFTPQWIDGLHSRIVSLIPQIRANAETFAAAGARVLGARRLGDQLGTLLAGAYALTTNKEITPEAASEWIEAQDWTVEKEMMTDTDGTQCYARIMEHQVMVEHLTGGQVKRSLGELVEMVEKNIGDGAVTYRVAVDTLRRHGVVFKDGAVAISNSHSEIGKILHDSPWSANWAARLKTIDGAKASPQAMSFGSGATARATLIPRVAPPR